MDADLRKALGAIAGARGVTDGGVVTTADTGQVASVLRLCAEHGTRAAVVSGAAGRGATPPEGAGVLLTLSRLDAVAVDAPAAVVRAGAGAALTAVREASEAAGRALVVAPPRAPSHVGSLVARGGLPRWALTGIEAVLGTGEVVRAGGTVQRDVTGYDLVAALLGSAGRLAVVTTVWLRLQPAGAPAAPHEAQGALETGQTLRAAFDPHGILVPAAP